MCRDSVAGTTARGLLPNFAQRRIALSFDAALASGRGHGKGAAGGTATGSGEGEGNDPQRTQDPSLRRGSSAAAAPDARRRPTRTADASPQQTHDGQKDDRSRKTGKGTILSKARPTAEIPLFYVSVNTGQFRDRGVPDGLQPVRLVRAAQADAMPPPCLDALLEARVAGVADMSGRAASCARFGQGWHLWLLINRLSMLAIRSFQARPAVIARGAHSPVA